MARTENQGLQIAVIVFAFLTIALSVATFCSFNAAATQFANATAQQEAAREMEAVARKALEDRQALSVLVDGKPDTRVNDARSRINDALRELGGVRVAQNESNCLHYLQALKGTLDQRNQALADLEKKHQDLDRHFKDVQKKYDELLAATKATYDASTGSLAKRVKALDVKDGDHVKRQKQLTADLDKQREAMTKALEEKNQEIQALQRQLAQAYEEVRSARDQLYALHNWVFERPDASIVSVNAKANSVTIDVGRQSLLPLHTRFGVFQQGETNVYNRKKKGAVSVTRIISDTLAEARIVESELKDPILPGDVVFTPIWTPGMQERFVLAGDFDLNSDGKPDNQLVETLVTMNGGIVEKSVEMTTRYLLQGDAPPKGKDKEAELKAYEEKRGRAKELSVKVMGLQEFLEYCDAHRVIDGLQNLDVRSKKDTGSVLKDGKRQSTTNAVNQKLEPEGGERRREYTSPSRIEAPVNSANEQTRDFKERGRP
jgi:hypothetical protein